MPSRRPPSASSTQAAEAGLIVRSRANDWTSGPPGSGWSWPEASPTSSAKAAAVTAIALVRMTRGLSPRALAGGRDRVLAHVVGQRGLRGVASRLRVDLLAPAVVEGRDREVPLAGPAAWRCRCRGRGSSGRGAGSPPGTSAPAPARPRSSRPGRPPACRASSPAAGRRGTRGGTARTTRPTCSRPPDSRAGPRADGETRRCRRRRARPGRRYSRASGAGAPASARSKSAWVAALAGSSEPQPAASATSAIAQTSGTVGRASRSRRRRGSGAGARMRPARRGSRKYRTGSGTAPGRTDNRRPHCFNTPVPCLRVGGPGIEVGPPLRPWRLPSGSVLGDGNRDRALQPPSIVWRPPVTQRASIWLTPLKWPRRSRLFHRARSSNVWRSSRASRSRPIRTPCAPGRRVAVPWMPRSRRSRAAARCRASSGASSSRSCSGSSACSPTRSRSWSTARCSPPTRSTRCRALSPR